VLAAAVRAITSGCDVPLIAVGVAAPFRPAGLSSHLGARPVRNIIPDGFEESGMMFDCTYKITGRSLRCMSIPIRVAREYRRAHLLVTQHDPPLLHGMCRKKKKDGSEDEAQREIAILTGERLRSLSSRFSRQVSRLR